MLELKAISKKFSSHSKPVLNELSLSIPQGEFLSLLGPSGCGKTTLLRILSGLEQGHEGDLILDGKSIKNLPPQKRPFNMVFQKHALFPHMKVFDNIAYGLRMKKMDEAEIRTRVHEILKLVDMEAFAERLPETLSGGQSQRIALARALVNRPQILLLDESLSALDEKLRSQMQRELKDLQRKLGITFIFVTHDQEEAFVLSDRVVLMNGGVIEQEGPPSVIYDRPHSLFAARFVGGGMEFPVDKITPEGQGFTSFTYGDFQIKGVLKNHNESENVAMIRSELLNLTKTADRSPELNHVSGKVISKTFRGSLSEVDVQVAQGKTVRAFLSPYEISFDEIQLNQDLHLNFAPEQTFIFYKRDT